MKPFLVIVGVIFFSMSSRATSLFDSWAAFSGCYRTVSVNAKSIDPTIAARNYSVIRDGGQFGAYRRESVRAVVLNLYAGSEGARAIRHRYPIFFDSVLGVQTNGALTSVYWGDATFHGAGGVDATAVSFRQAVSIRWINSSSIEIDVQSEPGQPGYEIQNGYRLAKIPCPNGSL